MTKEKLIKLRCKAWGITEAEYYCNQCSDFSLEDMSRAYRRGKNKGRADIAKENAGLKAQIEKMKRCEICKHYRWNHCSYEINISADCIQNKMKHFELKEIKENDEK